MLQTLCTNLEPVNNEHIINKAYLEFRIGQVVNGINYAMGKIGIGTATPTGKLTVDTGNITLTNEYGLGWGGAIPTNGIKGSASDNDASANYVAIKTNGTEKVRVDSSGNMNITGSIKFGNVATTCSPTTAGTMRYNNGSFEGCNGTSWGAIGGASASTCGSPISYAGETYPTVQIGGQCWFAKNLNVGTIITSPSIMPTNNSIIQKWCNGADTNNHTVSGDCATYGGLYTWDEMMGYTTTAGAQGICPTGWHIPTDTEWHTLESGLATGACAAVRGDFACDPAGMRLSTATLNGTNSSGFTALLAGGRNSTNGLFYHRGNYAYLWSSNNVNTIASIRGLSSDFSTVYRYDYDKMNGFSVRCVQD